MTDLHLIPYYDALLKAASQIIIDRIQRRFQYIERPTYIEQQRHLQEFRQRRAAFRRVCLQHHILIPRGMTLSQVQKFLLQQLIVL
jgi:hypothetical protein